jgi:hypothetical protein
MAAERTVHHEVVEESVQPADQSAAAPQRVAERTVTETHTVEPAVAPARPAVPVAPAQPAVTNVTVTDTAGAPGAGVSINTPDGTQVNINT